MGRRHANITRDLEPFRVLVEHRIDDVHEGFIAGEKPVPPREQIAFEPALAHVLAQDFHHTAIGRDMIVNGNDLGGRLAVRHVKERVPSIRSRFIGRHDTEILRPGIQRHHVAQERSHHARPFGHHHATLRHIHGIVAEIGQRQFLQQEPAIGVRICAHAPLALGRQRGILVVKLPFSSNSSSGR